MTEENHKQLQAVPAPYGRWPDGRPITQLEASAKQMDDWASMHGFSGHVLIGIGTQFEEPKKWHGVRVGDGPELPASPEPIRLPPQINEALIAWPKVEPTPPTPQSWLRKLWGRVKGFLNGQAS